MSFETTRRIGLAGAVLAVAAGSAELVVGSTSWTGDKDEPTTLGLVTIGLGVVMALAAWAVRRRRPTGELLAAAGGLAVPALVSLTTAGIVAVPGALIGLVAAASCGRLAAGAGPVGPVIRAALPTALLAVLAVIYLAFGAVSGVVGLLGVVGTAAMIASLAIARRSVAVATAVLVVGVGPFAILAWSSLVIPMTALLALAIGVPLVRRVGLAEPDGRDTAPTG